jgi:O-antigen/teichoic acid export membrane protein
MDAQPILLATTKHFRMPAISIKNPLRKGGLVGGSVHYLAANVLNAAVPFALLPILTRHLSTDAYGQVAMFQILVTALGAFVGVNVHGAASRKYFDDLSEIEMAKFIGCCVEILIASALLVLMLVAAFLLPLARATSLNPAWVILAVPTSAGIFLCNLRLVIWQCSQKPIRYGIFQVSQSLGNFALSISLVVLAGLAAEGRVVAQTCAASVAALIAVSLLRKDHLLRLDWQPQYCKEALAFGAPLIPHIFGLFLLSAADRIVIHAQLGVREVGVYMVAAQLALGLSILFDAVNKAYTPWLFEQLKRNDMQTNRRIVRLTYGYFAFVLALAAATFALGPTIVPWIAGERYHEAGHLLGWLALGQAFGGMYLMVTNYVFYSRRTGLLSLATLSTGVINLVLLVIMVDHLGLRGAAISFAVAMALRFLLTWCIAQYRHRMPWMLKFRPMEQQ